METKYGVVDGKIAKDGAELPPEKVAMELRVLRQRLDDANGFSTIGIEDFSYISSQPHKEVRLSGAWVGNVPAGMPDKEIEELVRGVERQAELNLASRIRTLLGL
jgi:hypothetical protein